MTRQTVTFEVSVELSARVNRTPNPSIYALEDIEVEAFIVDGIEYTPSKFNPLGTLLLGAQVIDAE